MPPGLQGVWAMDGVLPPWRGDYHNDMNVRKPSGRRAYPATWTCWIAGAITCRSACRRSCNIPGNFSQRKAPSGRASCSAKPPGAGKRLVCLELLLEPRTLVRAEQCGCAGATAWIGPGSAVPDTPCWRKFSSLCAPTCRRSPTVICMCRFPPARNILGMMPGRRLQRPQHRPGLIRKCCDWIVEMEAALGKLN